MAEAYEAIAHEDVEIWIVSSLGRPPKHWRCDRYFEQVPMSQMRHIYSSCDLLLKLSRVEGFFGPPMEMMACGGSVVVGRVTGLDEYIQDGVNALVVDPESPEEATTAVRRLIEDPALRASLVRAGLQTAGAWRWEPSIDILERYYLDVSADRRGVQQSRAASQRSFSISYFYGLLRGEVWEDPEDALSATVRSQYALDPGALHSAGLLANVARQATAADPIREAPPPAPPGAMVPGRGRGALPRPPSGQVLPPALPWTGCRSLT